MSNRFGRIFGKIKKSKMDPKEFEAKTGVKLEKATLDEDLKTKYEQSTDEEEKKKLRQRAFMLGVKLDK